MINPPIGTGAAGLSARGLRAMLFRSTYASHRMRHSIRHTAARAWKASWPVCRKRPRPCEKSKSWVADPAASRLEHGGGLATAAPISRGVSRVGRVRDCCDRLTARFGLIVALEAGEIGVQPAAAAIIAGSPARLIARRML